MFQLWLGEFREEVNGICVFDYSRWSGTYMFIVFPAKEWESGKTLNINSKN